MLAKLISAPFRRVVSYRGILLKTTLAEIRGMYAESAAGAAWVLFGPLLLVALYSVIYVAVLRIRPANLSIEQYLLYVFAGLLPAISFSGALSAGALSLIASRQVLLNTVFPAELLPMRAVLVQSATLPAGILLIAIASALTQGPTWALLAVPVVMVLQFLFLAGVAWVLSLVTLAVRDIQHLLQYLTLILLIVSPIAYTPDMIPPQLKLLMYLNPMYYFIVVYQYALALGQLPSWKILAAAFLIAGGAFVAGFWLFQRVKASFYDYA